MLNAYRGIFSDRYPVAPEFWCYYPAKVLGVDMVEMERNISLWKALLACFKKYGTEGWGCYYLWPSHPEVQTKETFTKKVEDRFLLTQEIRFKGRSFTSKRMYDKKESSWIVEYPLKNPSEDLDYFVEMGLPEKMEIDVRPAVDTYDQVGENYLLEYYLGAPFFDFISGPMGFEKGILYFMTEENQTHLEYLHKRYIDYLKTYINKVCPLLPYESFFIGCSWTTNSLIGPNLWRRWEKPVLKCVTDTLHKHGKLLHLHLHGKCMETAADLEKMGIDCVCPFERPPGGDVTDLHRLRTVLNGRVTMNGNVHTVETLIRGTPEDVEREVREIAEAFKGEPRLIIGTGDQVGKETPEENILAMIETAKSLRIR